jgi:hypothetical protein
MERMDLIHWLEQRRGNLTNEQFAATLRMSPASWSRLRTGRRPISHSDLGKALARYPQECDAILALWRGDRAA